MHYVYEQALNACRVDLCENMIASKVGDRLVQYGNVGGRMDRYMKFEYDNGQLSSVWYNAYLPLLHSLVHFSFFVFDEFRQKFGNCARL